MDEDHSSEHWVFEFLKKWFLGLFKGFKNHSSQVQADILKKCGIACAHPQAVNFFQEAWRKSQNIDQYIEILNHEYKANIFTKKYESSIQVQYSKCYCPLRRLNLVDSPLLQNCSGSWLHEVFKTALNTPISVKIVKTICSGADSCLFNLEFHHKEKNSLLEFQIYLKEALKLRRQVDEGLLDF
ncbi:MAG: hypothetical protein ACFFDC_19270 [Promethearchaeota archaeon]